MQLIVIRGPAGSGKSSVARELHETAKQKTALLPQDVFRVNIAKEQEGAAAITADVIKYAAKKFLDSHYTVILEGLFNIEQEHYKRLLEDLFGYNQGSNHLYFLEISLDESIKRNTARPKGRIIDESAMREWYPKAQKTNYKLERVIDVEEKSMQEVVDFIAEECRLDLDPNNYKKNIKPSI